MILRGAFKENFKMALSTLRSNKLRSFLTVFGVIVGVITVMLMSSIISGIKVGFEKEIESFGTNSIFLHKNSIVQFGRRNREERMRKPLRLSDAEAISELPAVQTAVPFLDVSSNRWGSKILITGKNGKTSSSVSLQGTYPTLAEANTEILMEGRWFTQTESDIKKDVALVGASVADDYFPNESAVGQTLEIGGREFRVIGVLEKREQFLGGGGGGDDDQSNVIYMPMGSAMRIKPNSEDLFILAVAKPRFMDKAKDQIEDLLRVRRQVPYGEPNNFSMATAASIIEQFNSITAGAALAMLIISMVGLMIGGIGVMNIMLVSVTERTREIGIRKAIGAKRSDILMQFLVEAATLTGLGGLLGLILGWLLTFLIALVFPSYVPWWAPVIGFFASIGIGVIFGLFPAWKAARLDPIESLRYE